MSEVIDPRFESIPSDAFTVDHFERWAFELTLDNGQRWRVEDYFLAFLEDVFAGYRIGSLVVPESNAKTTNLGGLAVYHCEFTPDGSVPWAASARDQAEIGYQQAAGFVRRSERLRETFKLLEGYRRIRSKDELWNSRIQIFASNEDTADGVIPTLAIVDEAHRHRSLALLRTWRGKVEKRGGQLLVISTAGEPGSEFEEWREKQRQAAKKIDRGECFGRFEGDAGVLHEWAVPEDGDVEDMALVAKANPASFVTEEDLTEKFHDPLMTLAHWRRFNCSLPTRTEGAAIEEAEWFAAATDGEAAKAAGIPAEIPKGAPIDAGLDVAWKYDCTALAPLWNDGFEKRLLGLAEILTPPMNGQMLDGREIRAALARVHERNPIASLVMDIHRAEEVAAWAQQELGCEVIDRGQSDSFATIDYARFMEGLGHHWLFWQREGNEALTRHVLNAHAYVLPKGDVRFERPKSSRGVGANRTANPLLQRARVIDGLTAAAMVNSFVAEQLKQPEAAEPMVAWA